MHVSTCVYVYVCVRTLMYMCLCTQKPKGLDPLELGLKVFVSLLVWLLGINLGPLEEQCSHLSAELSLLPRALEP